MHLLQLRVVDSTMPIKSIELQLIRVETCGCAEGYARDGMRVCISSKHYMNINTHLCTYTESCGCSSFQLQVCFCMLLLLMKHFKAPHFLKSSLKLTCFSWLLMLFHYVSCHLTPWHINQLTICSTSFAWNCFHGRILIPFSCLFSHSHYVPTGIAAIPVLFPWVPCLILSHSCKFLYVTAYLHTNEISSCNFNAVHVSKSKIK